MTAMRTRAPERRSLPERPCGVCLQGIYVTRLETDAYSGAGSLRRLGVAENEPGVAWHVEACNHCGHVQVFRRDWRR